MKCLMNRVHILMAYYNTINHADAQQVHIQASLNQKKKREKKYIQTMDVRETQSFQMRKESKQMVPGLQEMPAGEEQEVKLNLW